MKPKNKKISIFALLLIFSSFRLVSQQDFSKKNKENFQSVFVNKKNDTLYSTHSGIKKYIGIKKDGLYIEYYQTKLIKFKVQIKKGYFNGIGEYFNENNKLVVKSVFKKGELDGISLNYDEAGKIMIQKTFKNGLRDGVWIYYNNDGTIKKQEIYSKGELVK